MERLILPITYQKLTCPCMRYFAFFFALAMLVTTDTLSQDSLSLLKINRVEDFRLSGRGDNAAWTKTDWIKLSRTEGSLQYKTAIKMLYSSRGFYMLFQCEDSTLTATLRNDFDDLWTEDVVEVFFWTDQQTPLYFEYELSPLNKELPILVPNFGGEFLGWQPWKYNGSRKIDHAVFVLKKGEKITGWNAEFFIPFELLKPLQNVPPVKGTRWRMNMYRIDYDNPGPTEWAWRPVKTNFHEYKSFGEVEFN
jgi:hypothetical protein